MPRRISCLHFGLGLGLLLSAGCGTGQSPAPNPGPQAAVKGPAVPAANPITAAGTGSEHATPASQPPIEITPGSSTITADDPGLQLLASDEAEPARDRTAQVAWSAEPSGLVAIEPGSLVRRAGGERGVRRPDG
jgi:hypothetical protein